MYNDNFYKIDDILVRKEIFETRFACDLLKCKGACCTMESKYGAPLLEEEISLIKKYLGHIFPYLSNDHKQEIEENGFWEKKEGSLMTRSVDYKACVFVYYEGKIAKCAIEKAFNDGKIDFKKPISCHLFPIRVSNFGGDILKFEKFKECEPALENGNKNNITVAEFCKDSLLRSYGMKWYRKFREFIRS